MMMENKQEEDFIIENVRLSLSNKSDDCHKNSIIIAEHLKRMGYNVRVVTGIYSNPPKNIKHSWIETEDKILETDCMQLREIDDIMPDKFCAVLNKTDFAHRYIKK